MEPVTSLREHKKSRTRQELAQAAYEVIRDHGVDALSADAIVQRAGVSRRTFFNYFPTVEAAVVPVVEEFLDALTQRVQDADVVTDRPVAAMAELARSFDDAEMLERFTVIGTMACRSEAHQSLVHACAQDWMEGFIAILRSRLDVDELTLTLMAYSFIAAGEASLRVWMDRTGGEITPQTIVLRRELLADAIARLGAGFDPR